MKSVQPHQSSSDNKLTYYSVGHIDEFFARIGRVVHLRGKEIAVFRSEEGDMFALENKSPHPKGGPLAEGIVSGRYLYEPLHDWKIDMADGMVQAPDTGSVQTYRVRVTDGGEVQIGMTS